MTAATPPPGDARAAAAARARRFVILLGWVSLFADLCYEGMRGAIGGYLAALGASAAAVGMVAGTGEAIGYGLRYVSGALADRNQSSSDGGSNNPCPGSNARNVLSTGGFGAPESDSTRCAGSTANVTSQVSAGSQGRPSASMTRVSKKCLPCFAAVER